MLDTFKARLKAKSTAAGANLSQKRIDAIADRLHKKFPDPKDEAEHDANIDTLYDATDLKEFAQVDDYQRTKEAKDKKDKEELDRKAAEEARRKEQEGSKDDMPVWAKTLLEQNKALTEKISGFEKEKVQGTIKQQASAKLKDIPAKYYENWQLPEKEEDLDAFVEKVTTGYEGFKQDLTNQGLSLLGTPPAAGGTPPGGAGKVNPIVKAYADKQAAQQVQKT